MCTRCDLNSCSALLAETQRGIPVPLALRVSLQQPEFAPARSTIHRRGVLLEYSRKLLFLPTRGQSSECLASAALLISAGWFLSSYSCYQCWSVRMRLMILCWPPSRVQWDGPRSCSWCSKTQVSAICSTRGCCLFRLGEFFPPRALGMPARISVT